MVLSLAWSLLALVAAAVLPLVEARPIIASMLHLRKSKSRHSISSTEADATGVAHQQLQAGRFNVSDEDAVHARNAAKQSSLNVQEASRAAVVKQHNTSVIAHDK